MTVENAVKNNGGKNMSYNEFLPSYSIGDDCYKEIPYVTRRYGKTAVVIGGKTAMEKAKPELLAALKGSDLEITDFIWYGGDSNYENIEMLKAMPEVQNADVVFGVGGGRAVDTVKTLCDRIDKPFFTFPTLASNCASCTAISVIYNADGTFKEYAYLKAPALHTFINTKIIAESPEKLFWAGIGDALSKEYEVVFACRDKDMTHTPLLGRVLAEACTEPLVSYGKKALEDCRNNVSSKNIEQIALDIIITTGLVSNFTVHQNNPVPKDDYYYNSSLAHCVYYGASLFPKCEHDHLHGEIVSFGVLCLLTYDEQFEERQRIFEFNRSIGLPCTLGEIALTEEDVPAIAHKAASVVEWTYVPGEPTEEKFIKAILDTDKAGKEFLAKRI